MIRTLKLAAIWLAAATLVASAVLYVDQRLSRECPGGEVLGNNTIALAALTWLLEERSDGLGYNGAADALRHNPDCCTLIDPAEHPATNPVYGMPGRTGLMMQMMVPHYTIVEVRLIAASAQNDRPFGGTVAVDRCGEILSGSHGG